MLGDRDELADYSTRLCVNCPHRMMIHARHGGCHAQGCLCGWSREARSEALSVIAETNAGRKRNRGARVSTLRRQHLMKVPCYFCGGRPETIDHLIARAKGGTSDSSNLVSACALCNSMKSDKSYDELIAFCMELRVTTNQKTALRHVLRFQRYKQQAERILTWHEKRLKSKSVPVV